MIDAWCNKPEEITTYIREIWDKADIEPKDGRISEDEWIGMNALFQEKTLEKFGADFKWSND